MSEPKKSRAELMDAKVLLARSGQAPPAPPSKPLTPLELKKNAHRKRVKDTNELVATATAVTGERRCTGRVKVRDEEGEPILDAEGGFVWRPCKAFAIKGGRVCLRHGGRAPQVKAKAQKRLLALVEPAMVRLGVLVQQDVHLPTALGAIRTILERAGDEAIGVIKARAQTDGANTRPIINIGIKVGGINTPAALPDITVVEVDGDGE